METKQESQKHAELNDWVEDVIDHLMKTKGLPALDHVAKKLAARNDFIQWYYANEDDDVCWVKSVIVRTLKREIGLLRVATLSNPPDWYGNNIPNQNKEQHNDSRPQAHWREGADI